MIQRKALFDFMQMQVKNTAPVAVKGIGLPLRARHFKNLYPAGDWLEVVAARIGDRGAN